MEKTENHSEDAVRRILRDYGDMLYRLCLILLKRTQDAEDALQETLIKYCRKSPPFESREHEKAWLIRVATKQCRDLLRFRARHPLMELTQERSLWEPESSGILEALTAVPEPYRIVLTLYYVEEYPVKEIAKIIGRTPSAVKMRLQKGRKLLEEIYRKEYL